MTDDKGSVPSLRDRGESTVRWGLLLNGSFLTALAILVVNDWVLKPAFGNALTGKLSDFAGLYALSVLASAIYSKRPGLLLSIIGGLFILWKSELSQPIIDGWNSLKIFPVGRTVDSTDLLALVMLPVAWAYLKTAKTGAARPHVSMAVAAASVIAFAATSYRSVVPYENSYHFDVGVEALKSSLDAIGYQIYYFAEDSLQIKIPSDRCFDSVTARLGVAGSDAESIVRVLRIIHHCPGKSTDRELLQRILEDSVIAKLRR